MLPRGSRPGRSEHGTGLGAAERAIHNHKTLTLTVLPGMDPTEFLLGPGGQQTGVLSQVQSPLIQQGLERCQRGADLEAAAISVEPEIGAVLATLRDEPEVLLARVSGSGGTCFALCPDDISAETLAERIEAVAPTWWVRRCRLGGPWA